MSPISGNDETSARTSRDSEYQQCHEDSASVKISISSRSSNVYRSSQLPTKSSSDVSATFNNTSGHFSSTSSVRSSHSGVKHRSRSRTRHRRVNARSNVTSSSTYSYHYTASEGKPPSPLIRTSPPVSYLNPPSSLSMTNPSGEHCNLPIMVDVTSPSKGSGPSRLIGNSPSETYFTPIPNNSMTSPSLCYQSCHSNLSLGSSNVHMSNPPKMKMTSPVGHSAMATSNMNINNPPKINVTPPPVSHSAKDSSNVDMNNPPNMNMTPPPVSHSATGNIDMSNPPKMNMTSPSVSHRARGSTTPIPHLLSRSCIELNNCMDDTSELSSVSVTDSTTLSDAGTTLHPPLWIDSNDTQLKHNPMSTFPFIAAQTGNGDGLLDKSGKQFTLRPAPTAKQVKAILKARMRKLSAKVYRVIDK